MIPGQREEGQGEYKLLGDNALFSRDDYRRKTAEKGKPPLRKIRFNWWDK